MENKDQKTLIEINPNILKNADEADRSDWSYETYVSVGMEVSQVKGYVQWILGKLAHEVEKKWGAISDFSKDIGQNRNSIYAYKSIYEKFTREDPNFVPDGSMPYGILMEAAKEENSIETIKDLQEKGITSVPEASRELSIKRNGGIELPRKPKQPRWSWSKELEQYELICELTELDKPIINLEKFHKQLIDLALNQ